jgi:predicted NAD/FAD-binding protein
MDTTAPQQLVRTDYRHYARPLLSMAKVLSVYLMKYRRFLAPPGFDGMEKTDLAHCTMDQWLAKYHLDHLKALLSPYYVSWGYGYLEQVSAAYVFKLLDFYIRILGRIYLFPQKNRPSSYLLEGYQKLFEIIAQPFELILGANITKIDRHQSIDILCDGQKRSFDALILAAPFQKTAGFLDLVAKERALFGKIKTFNFYTVTATVKNLPPDHLIFIPNHLTSHRAGRMVSWYRRWPDRDVAVFYLLSHQHHSMDRLVTGLRSDLARVGAEMTKVLRCDHWNYFPHVPPPDFANGFYDQFEQMQGRRNTWYTGELLSFATVEHVVAYSRDLIERYF